jgi:SAM-dependent methyltransferase
MPVNDQISPRVRAASRCPDCEGQLTWSEEDAHCSSCTKRFIIARGVPLLLPTRGSLFKAELVAAAPAMRTARAGMRRFLPSISRNVVAERNYRTIRSSVSNLAKPALVLIVGGGESGKGSSVLYGPGVEVVLSDVAISDSTDVCLDAHCIPFADGTFDVVVAQAVLEHVVDPQQCVAEIHRVLRNDGLVYAETPFMQQVHLGAFDFTRFSLLGHRRLFRMFREVDSGVAVGPGSALAWAFVYLVTSFSRGPRSRRWLSAGARYAAFWLKYLDRPLEGRPAAADAASGVFFLGRKTDIPIEDEELISTYSGGL